MPRSIDDAAPSAKPKAQNPVPQLIATLRSGDFPTIYDASRSLAKLG